MTVDRFTAHQRRVAAESGVTLEELDELADLSAVLRQQLIDPDFGPRGGELDLEAIEAVLDQEDV